MAEAMAAGRIAAEPLDMGAIAAMQPGQTGRKRALVARLAGLALLGRARPRYRGLISGRGAAEPGRRDLRNFIGIARRALTGRLQG